MSKLILPLTDKQMKKLGVNDVRTSYSKLAVDYNRIINRDVLMCPKCGDWQLTSRCFYSDKRYVTGCYPICKKCIMEIVEQRENENDPPNETRESVQRALKLLDKPYLEDIYAKCVKGALDDVNEKQKQSPFATYIASILGFPQYKDKTYADSNFGDAGESMDEVKLNQRTIKAAKKRFGAGYSDEEYMFLENEYQDFIQRYECNTKAQEIVFKNLSMAELTQRKLITQGRSTKDTDTQIQNWMKSGAIEPRQNSLDTLSEAQTFGTLIQKFEEERPLPIIDPELQDVDKIGRYIDAYYKGHMCKMLEIDNNFSHLYEDEMRKYTVDKPQYDDEEDSEGIFAKIFGAQLDG